MTNVPSKNYPNENNNCHQSFAINEKKNCCRSSNSNSNVLITTSLVRLIPVLGYGV